MLDRSSLACNLCNCLREDDEVTIGLSGGFTIIGTIADILCDCRVLKFGVNLEAGSSILLPGGDSLIGLDFAIFVCCDAIEFVVQERLILSDSINSTSIVPLGTSLKQLLDKTKPRSSNTEDSPECNLCGFLGEGEVVFLGISGGAFIAGIIAEIICHCTILKINPVLQINLPGPGNNLSTNQPLSICCKDIQWLLRF